MRTSLFLSFGRRRRCCESERKRRKVIESFCFLRFVFLVERVKVKSSTSPPRYPLHPHELFIERDVFVSVAFRPPDISHYTKLKKEKKTS